MNTRRSRRLAGAIAGVATLAIAVFAVGAAEADPITGTSGVTGTVQVGENSFALPDGSAFTGTLDPDAGTIEGDVTIPDLVYTVTDPVAAVATIAISIPDGITGTVDGDGNVSAAGTARIEITDVDILPGAIGTCVFEPVDLELDGTYDAEAGTVHLADEQFTIPATSDSCTIAALVNPMLAGDENSMVLDIALGVAPTPTTTTTTTTTAVPATTAPATTAPAATPAGTISGAASYTG